MRDLAIIVRDTGATRCPILGLLPAIRSAHAFLRAGADRLWVIARDREFARTLLDAMPGPMRGRVRACPDPQHGEVETLREIAETSADGLVVVPSDVVVDIEAARRLMTVPLPDGGIVDAGHGVLVVTAQALREASGDAIEGLCASLDSGARVVRPDIPGLIGGASDPASRRALEGALLRALRKPVEVEGVIGYYVQRPLTRHVSRLLVRTRIHPNHISILAMAAGVASGILVATSDALWTALGGVLFFAGSLLDCLDGEVARLRFQCSHLGEWLDTLADDVSTLSFLIGMTLNLHSRHASPVLDAIGVLTVLEFVLASAYVYHRIATVYGSGDVTVFRYSFQREDGSSRSKVMWLLKWVVKRDFFAAWFCVTALAGVIEAAAAFSAMGAFGFALAVVVTALNGNGRVLAGPGSRQVASP